MGWLVSLFIGVITGLITMVAAFATADMAVRWHNVSSFEGGSGYLVIAMAAMGLFGGFVIGTVASRIVAARQKRSTEAIGTGRVALKAVGVALATSLTIVAIIGVIARQLADVPPTLDGQELLLAAEIRWPEGQTPPALNEPDEWSLRLGSSSGRTMRASVTGPLWREDARLEDGRWVVPGAVELFTSRGERILDVLPDNTITNGFIVPLPARPGAEFLEWSEWLPHARDGEPALPDGFRYRFRVVPRNAPVRTETVGPFEIATVASGFNEITSGGPAKVWSANATFRITHRGQPITVESHTEFSAVALLGGEAPALLVQASGDDAPGACYFVSINKDAVQVAPIGTCEGSLQARPLTSDHTAFTRARDRSAPAGRIDRVSFATPGLYLFDGMVVDTRTRTSRTFSTEGQSNLIARIPPLGISPDEASFIRLESADSNEQHVLAVTMLGTGDRYRLPIDNARMRYATIDQIDPAWVLHHFVWERALTGTDRLVERPTFTPIAWRGTLTDDYTGYREYRVAPATAGLRPALIDFLVAEFQAERVPTEPDAFSHQVLIKGATIHISFDERERHVGLWMDRGTDSQLVATIAARFDTALATGRYDHLFGS